MNPGAAPQGGWRPLLKADWTQFVFLHYALPPAVLAPCTPLPLACRDGRAFVSLVFFRFERMRPAHVLAGPLGGALFGPASDCWFLNLRTYVRGPAGPGIQFLVEWMDNPLSLHLGPLLYGLPYRRGRFQRAAAPGGALELRVADVETGDRLRVRVLAGAAERRPADPGALEAFLLEQYTAYTHRRRVTRYFRIAHPRWQTAPATVAGLDAALIVGHCPWFRQAQLVSAQVAAGFPDVAMGAPHRLGRPAAPAAAAGGVAGTPQPE